MCMCVYVNKICIYIFVELQSSNNCYITELPLKYITAVMRLEIWTNVLYR